MDKQKKEPQQHDRLEEQQAPLKNTDQAFVQVGHDGEPVIPKRSAEEESTQNDLRDSERGTTIKHR